MQHPEGPPQQVAALSQPTRAIATVTRATPHSVNMDLSILRAPSRSDFKKPNHQYHGPGRNEQRIATSKTVSTANHTRRKHGRHQSREQPLRDQFGPHAGRSTVPNHPYTDEFYARAPQQSTRGFNANLASCYDKRRWPANTMRPATSEKEFLLFKESFHDRVR